MYRERERFVVCRKPNSVEYVCMCIYIYILCVYIYIYILEREGDVVRRKPNNVANYGDP